MSAADPRPAYRPYRLTGKSSITHEGSFELVAVAHRNATGAPSRWPATVHVDAKSGALEIGLPQMSPELARRLASEILKAADDAEAIDAWHERNPQVSEAAA